MGDTSWKKHERIVAQYFNTSRRCRGANFAQSDVEVLCYIKDWITDKEISGREVDKIGIVVECKYRKTHPLIDLCQKNSPTSNLFIGRIKDFHLYWLEDFKKIFINVIIANDLNFVLNNCNIKIFDKETPQYLYEYREQARKYTLETQDALLPIVCMAKNKGHKRLVAIHSEDLYKFSSLINTNGINIKEPGIDKE